MHKIGRFGAYSILLLALVIQVAVLDHFKLFGARPDLIAMCVIFFGLFLGRPAGFESGIVAGLVTDLYSLDYFGINTVVYAVTGFLAGALKSSFAKESKRSQALLVFGCTAFSMCLHFALAAVFSHTLNLGFGEYLGSCVVPAALYTALVSVPVYIKFSSMYDLKEQDDLL